MKPEEEREQIKIIYDKADTIAHNTIAKLKLSLLNQIVEAAKNEDMKTLYLLSYKAAGKTKTLFDEAIDDVIEEVENIKV